MTNTQKMLKPNRRQKLKAGDYFAIPLKNGEYGLGQILDMVECVDNATCVLFNQKFLEGTPILATSNDVICAQYVVGQLLRRYFPIVQSGVVDNQLLQKYFPEHNRFKQGNIVGMTSYQTGIVEMFLNAYFGLTFWNECHNPNYYDTLLVSLDKKPLNLMYRKVE